MVEPPWHNSPPVTYNAKILLETQNIRTPMLPSSDKILFQDFILAFLLFTSPPLQLSNEWVKARLSSWQIASSLWVEWVFLGWHLPLDLLAQLFLANLMWQHRLLSSLPPNKNCKIMLEHNLLLWLNMFMCGNVK